jgi:hypothetical protein
MPTIPTQLLSGSLLPFYRLFCPGISFEIENIPPPSFHGEYKYISRKKDISSGIKYGALILSCVSTDVVENRLIVKRLNSMYRREKLM